MRVLHLTLEKKWFDMILSGEKKEEYREIKEYWDKRLDHKSYDVVSFRNGYKKDSPRMTVEFHGHGWGSGMCQWGAPENELVHIIKLGKVLESFNIKR